MLEKLLEAIIKDLGPTGLLVVGLYFAICRPLAKIAFTLAHINDELTNIISLLYEIANKKNSKT